VLAEEVVEHILEGGIPARVELKLLAQSWLQLKQDIHTLGARHIDLGLKYNSLNYTAKRTAAAIRETAIHLPIRPDPDTLRSLLLKWFNDLTKPHNTPTMEHT